MISDLLFATLLGMILLPLYESIVGLYYVLKRRYKIYRDEPGMYESLQTSIMAADVPWRYRGYLHKSFRSISPWSVKALSAWAIIACLHYLILKGVGL